MSLPQNILVPTDFSKYSSKALAEAVDIAHRSNANLHVLHVVEPRETHQLVAEFAIDQDGLRKKLSGDTKPYEEKMAQLIGTLGETKGVRIVTDVKAGVPSEVILQTQQEKKIDMIMMGSNGEKGFLKNLLGDVSYQVVKGAPCTVTVVRP